MYILGKITFAELQRSTGISKSSLYMHLQVLEENCLIKLRKTFTMSGPRTVIEITDKGIEVIKRYMDIIRKINI